MTVEEIQEHMRGAESKIIEAVMALERNGIKFLDVDIERIEMTTKDSGRRIFAYKAHIRTELTSGD